MEFETLLKNYKPSDEVVSLFRGMKLVLLCGIAGAGKNTIETRLLEDGDMQMIITSTTRPPRENNGVMEQHGREYYFYSKQQAHDMLERGDYFEAAHVHNNIYGVTINEIHRLHDAGKTVVGDVDYQGIEYYKTYNPDATVIFIVPPSYDVWHARMQGRYDTVEEFEQELPIRSASAKKELEWALDTPYIEFLVNDDLDEAVAEARRIVAGESDQREQGLKVAQEMLERLR